MRLSSRGNHLITVKAVIMTAMIPLYCFFVLLTLFLTKAEFEPELVYFLTAFTMMTQVNFVQKCFKGLQFTMYFKMYVKRVNSILNLPSRSLYVEELGLSEVGERVSIKNGNFTVITPDSELVPDLKLKEKVPKKVREEVKLKDDGVEEESKLKDSHEFDIESGGQGGNEEEEEEVVDEGEAIEIGKDKHKSVLSNVNFSARDGEVVAVVGAVGSGKTTLLLAIAGEA